MKGANGKRCFPSAHHFSGEVLSFIMPTYVYQCKSCGHRFEAWQHMTDEPLTTCPQCGEAIHRVIFANGVVFKGSGFYSTDARKASEVSVPAATASTDAPKTDAAKTDGTKSETAKSTETATKTDSSSPAAASTPTGGTTTPAAGTTTS
jgi:putative FmdB family regulatory protein